MHLASSLKASRITSLTRQLQSFALSSALVSLGLMGCSKEPIGPGVEDGDRWGISETAQAPGLTILGEGQKPLVNAKVLIGSAQDIPFSGNFLVTDSEGHLDLPAGWVEMETITIEAPGYLRTTYFAQEPGNHTYQLRKKAHTTATQYEVKGVTQGHNIKDRDGFVDLSLVIPAMTRNDFLSFNVNSVISPQTDLISVLGQEAEVPSNVAFPKQRESYIVPVTLDKPGYRIYFGEPGMRRVFAARASFPFKEVVDRIRDNAPFYTLVNYFNISGGGIKDLNLVKSITQVDLSVNELDFKAKVPVMAPSLRGDETMMAVGVAHMAEYMIPTDVKIMKSGQKLALSSFDTSKASVFSVLKKTKDLENMEEGSDRLSAVMSPAGRGVAPQFLPIMADPALDRNGDLLVSKMSSIAGVHPVATYAVLSQIKEVQQGKHKLKVNDQYWEMYGPQWMEVVSLPRWPEGQNPSGPQRWEVNLVGSTTVSEVDLGPAMINNVTHVTHSSLVF